MVSDKYTIYHSTGSFVVRIKTWSARNRTSQIWMPACGSSILDGKLRMFRYFTWLYCSVPLWSNFKYLLLFCDARYFKIFGPENACSYPIFHLSVLGFYCHMIVWMLLAQALKLLTLLLHPSHSRKERWTCWGWSMDFRNCVHYTFMCAYWVALTYLTDGPK